MKNPLNKKCECGSGRKARYCCQRELAQSVKNDLITHQAIKAAKQIEDKLIDFVSDFYDRAIISLAWEDFVSSEAFEDTPEEFATLFIPWMIFHWRCEYSGTIEGKLPKPNQRIGKVFLDKYKHELNPYEKAYLESGLKEPFSYYSIEKLGDKQVVLKDLLRSEDGAPRLITIEDDTFTEEADIGDILFATIIEVMDHYFLGAVSSNFFHAQYDSAIDAIYLDMIELHGVPVTNKTLLAYQDTLIERYWMLLESASIEEDDTSATEQPKLRNTSGEHLCHHELRYEVEDGLEAAEALIPLMRHKTWEKEALGVAGELVNSDEGLEFPWQSKEDNPNLGGQTAYGHITIKRNVLTIAVNSTARAERIKKEIKKRLGKKAKFIIDKIENINNIEELKSLTASKDKILTSRLSELPPEIQEERRQMAEKRKMAWFDQKIPLLDNKSPRQAAKSAKGRENLEKLIAYYDRNHSTSDPDDFVSLMNPTGKEIRDELGL